MNINIQDITFRYAGQKKPVFQDFSLELSNNCIYGLLGKNGTGKSTLLYLIAGLLRPDKGTVAIDGVQSKERQVDLLREVFFVPEEFDLPNMSFQQYVKMNEKFYPRFSREVLERCMNDFEMPTTINMQSLSMGQKKKVFMSVALAAGTRLLLMDEPTNGLDIPSKSQFRKTVAENMTDDRSLIISTHQVHDVEPLLDHVLMISETELLLNASVADITDRYSFEVRQVNNLDSVIYAEPSLQGNLVMAERHRDMPETNMNLELLFNAVTKGLIK